MSKRAILYFVVIIIIIMNLRCRVISDLPETVVLISIETLRPEHLSCYNYSRKTSPNIDNLAQDGILYYNCFAAASSTGPSVASILTSQYPSEHGVREFFFTRLKDSANTIAESLSKRGYLCAAFVGNPVITKERNLGQGFDLYDDALPQVEIKRYTSERIASSLTDAAIKWLKSSSSRRFVWLHYQDPHGPYFPPKRWRTRFSPGKTAFEKKELPFLNDYGGYGGIPAYQKLFQRHDVGYYIAMYDSEIQYMDNALGRFFKYMKEAGLYRRSLIIVTADHGEAFGENNYYFAHGHLSTPDQTKVPLIVKLPENIKPRSKVSYQPVSTLDIGPSILSILHIQSPKEYKGMCLPGFPAYSNKNHRIFYSETPWHYAAISDSHYYTHDKPQFEKEFVNPISGGVIYPMAPQLYDIRKGNLTLNTRNETASITENLNSALERFYKIVPIIAEKNIPDEKKKTLRSLGYLQ